MMTATMGYYGEAFEQVWQERLTEQLLQFARTHALGWLMRWNSASNCPLNQQDIEDILSEVLIATLRFRVPPGAKDWEPCLMAYIKRVAYRVYCRVRAQQHAEVSLEELPPSCQPVVWIEETCCEEPGACAQSIAQGLMRMPRHHALAFLLHLEADLVEVILQAGGAPLCRHLNCDALTEMPPRLPLRDRDIAALLGLTPRAVIRARQHARERLRNQLQNLTNLQG
jgi:DNA-directed RNA polymerase specialized sigma24 family protein